MGGRLGAALLVLGLGGGGAVSFVLTSSPSYAQQGAAPVQTLPAWANSGDASGSITSTDAFQQVWASTPGPHRIGCLVVNNSTHRQWVFFGSTPTKATSLPLEPASATNALGGAVSCATGAGGALQDQVWITGTSGDTFVAKQQ